MAVVFYAHGRIDGAALGKIWRVGQLSCDLADGVAGASLIVTFYANQCGMSVWWQA